MHVKDVNLFRRNFYEAFLYARFIKQSITSFTCITL
jgi:hypothetical protein